VKVAVVTGASSGVGSDIARRFVGRGWRVYGLARHEQTLAAVRTELGQAFVPLACDVRDATAVQAVFAKVASAESRIDLLVNNAAVFKMASFRSFALAEIDAIVDTNLKGTIYCTHAALPLLGAGSRIVNIGSVAGTHGIPTQAAYCASKFGVDGFAEALGQELLADGIAITTICPGGIDTPLWQADGNPYPGDLAKILAPSDVVDVVEHVADLPPRIVLKKVVLFPSNEWH
jgi:NADP-dependent 3-hydroxy acid dehydrogenase YdfG